MIWSLQPAVRDRRRSGYGLRTTVRDAHRAGGANDEPEAHVVVALEHQQRAGALRRESDGLGIAEDVPIGVFVGVGTTIHDHIPCDINGQHGARTDAGARAAIDRHDVVLADEFDTVNDRNDLPADLLARGARQEVQRRRAHVRHHAVAAQGLAGRVDQQRACDRGRALHDGG